MNLRTYTLSVSLAAVIGILATTAPLIRNLLEYRSPQMVDARPELASLSSFVLASRGRQELSFDMARIIYDVEREQHFYAVRAKAQRGLISYGALFVVCGVMLAIHLRWGLRLSRQEKGKLEEQTGQFK